MKTETVHEHTRVGARSSLQDVTTAFSTPGTLPNQIEKDANNSTQLESSDGLKLASDSAYSTGTTSVDPRKILDALDPFSPENVDVTVYVPSNLYHAVLRDIYPAFFEDEPMDNKQQLRLVYANREFAQFEDSKEMVVPATESVLVSGPSTSTLRNGGKRLRMHSSSMQQKSGISTGDVAKEESAALSGQTTTMTKFKETEEAGPPSKKVLTDMISSIVSEYAQRLVVVPKAEAVVTPATSPPAKIIEKPQEVQRPNKRSRRPTRSSRVRLVGTVSLPENRITSNRHA